MRVDSIDQAVLRGSVSNPPLYPSPIDFEPLLHSLYMGVVGTLPSYPPIHVNVSAVVNNPIFINIHLNVLAFHLVTLFKILWWTSKLNYSNISPLNNLKIHCCKFILKFTWQNLVVFPQVTYNLNIYIHKQIHEWYAV